MSGSSRDRSSRHGRSHLGEACPAIGRFPHLERRPWRLVLCRRRHRCSTLAGWNAWESWRSVSEAQRGHVYALIKAEDDKIGLYRTDRRPLEPSLAEPSVPPTAAVQAQGLCRVCHVAPKRMRGLLGCIEVSARHQDFWNRVGIRALRQPTPSIRKRDPHIL